MNKEDAHIVVAMANHNMNAPMLPVLFSHTEIPFSITWTR